MQPVRENVEHFAAQISCVKALGQSRSKSSFARIGRDTIQRTDVTGPLSRRSWGGTRDEPKNVCVGGYITVGDITYV